MTHVMVCLESRLGVYVQGDNAIDFVWVVVVQVVCNLYPNS